MSDGPIDRYLDELFVELRHASPRDARSLLSETESHLRDAADEAVRGGMDETDAEAAAVLRFGSPDDIARRDRHRGRTGIVQRVIVSAWPLGALGALAVGLSGVIAGFMRLAGASNSFIAGDPSTGRLSPADCARWLAGYPHAASCAQAALADWAWDTVGFRIAAGILGAIALAVFVVVRRRIRWVRGWTPLPATVVDTVATTMFGAAGLWLAGMAVDALVVSSGSGAGQWLSAAPVALVAALIFGLRLVRDVTPAA